MSTLIDIKARVFSSEDRAFRLFPGVRYRHYGAMKKHSMVFLDYPGLRMPGSDGFGQNDVDKEALVRAELQAGVAFRASDNASELMAEISQRDLSGVRWSKRRLLALGWINALYHEAREGDLIVVPGPLRRRLDEETAKTLVGEITGPTHRWAPAGEPLYARAGMLARSVNWLESIDERDLDFRTAQSLRTQNALISLPAKSLGPVLGAAYRNVVLNEDYLARFVTLREESTSRESYHFQAFVLSIVNAFEQRNSSNPIIKDSIYAMAADVARGDAGIPEQDFSIHSPGYTTLKGTRVVFVIAALFAAALSASAEPIDESKVNLQMMNSVSSLYDPCEPQGLQDDVMATLRVLGYDRWKEACRAALAASEDEGFKPVSSAQ